MNFQIIRFLIRRIIMEGNLLSLNAWATQTHVAKQDVNYNSHFHLHPHSDIIPWLTYNASCPALGYLPRPSLSRFNIPQCQQSSGKSENLTLGEPSSDACGIGTAERPGCCHLGCHPLVLGIVFLFV